MKHAWLSIIVSLLGIIWLVFFNFQFSEILTDNYHQSAISGEAIICIDPRFPRVYKMSGLIIGLIGIFFGIKGYSKIKTLSTIGIIMSILLIFLAFLPLYSYFLSEAVYDVFVK